MTDRQTGYPSIDRPWLKYYRDFHINISDNERTIYNLIFDRNKQYLDDIAVNYFGNKISYQKVFSETDACAKSLMKIGFKRGDCVNLCTAGIPEAIYVVLACSKIGLVANFINPLFAKDQMIERINDTESEWILILDAMYDYVKDSLEKTCIKNVVIIPATNSVPAVASKIMYLKSDARKILKEKGKSQEYYSWNDFKSIGEKYLGPIDIAYERDTATIMVYSSGSTGASKGIVHTNESINATIQDSISSGLDLNRNMSFLQMIPIWFSTGIVQSILLPIAMGVTVILEPHFDPKAFVKDIMKYSPAMTIVATSIWMAAIKDRKFDKADLSTLIYPFTGGEKLISRSEQELNTFLSAHGCKAHVMKGYGMCELGGKVTDSIVANKEASVGIPMADIVVGIFDPLTNEELPYGKHGEIRVDSPAHMKEYFKNEKATNEYFWRDKNGILWGCTGDIGYMDEDGLLFVLGRSTDKYINENGKVVYFFDVEEEIIKDSEVSECKVVEAKVGDSIDIVAHLVLKSIEGDNKRVINRINEKVKESLPDYMVPKFYKIRESMPVHTNGKRDVGAIRRDIENLIKAD